MMQPPRQSWEIWPEIERPAVRRGRGAQLIESLRVGDDLGSVERLPHGIDESRAVRPS